VSQTLKDMLPAKAPQPDTKLPHTGQYSADELAWAVKAGYSPVDVRFAGSAYLILQGVMMGTVALTDRQMQALEMRSRLEKLGLREDETQQGDQAVREDALSALRNLPSSNLFALGRPKEK
jgi:hypothetical protein